MVANKAPRCPAKDVSTTVLRFGSVALRNLKYSQRMRTGCIGRFRIDDSISRGCNAKTCS